MMKEVSNYIKEAPVNWATYLGTEDTWVTVIRLRKGREPGPMLGESYEDGIFYDYPPSRVKKKGRIVTIYRHDGTIEYIGDAYIYRRFTITSFIRWWGLHKQDRWIFLSESKSRRENIEYRLLNGTLTEKDKLYLQLDMLKVQLIEDGYTPRHKEWKRRLHKFGEENPLPQ